MKRSILFNGRGFLVLEILIAGLILTSGIAATMYLFRMGFEHLEKARISNLLSAKLVQANGLIQSLELEKISGSEDMGDGVTLSWNAGVMNSFLPTQVDRKKGSSFLYHLVLYKVEFRLSARGTSRDYSINVFKYKALQTTNEKSS
ncbi:hypothetical protein SAMN04489760_14011 [Syntrophus gentianae]|uniref:Prepilin-type N-terminal cleavage/methylation domain-containing protein n=1 Tax=Syntrophus gentianae TaxID=43775 RepID=A0A1H8AUV7_9BACT|nr:hypothetical protein [Syntrophus gentianae]SEM73588.1 hypothetical protein SAMN04489760_14011 [Syntrophus gentianae]